MLPMLLIVVFGLVTLFAVVYVGFEVRLLIGYLSMRPGRDPESPRPGSERASLSVPKVLVQVPIFNEGAVARNVVAAVGALDYPRDRLQIQILDDSTDATPALIAPLIERLRCEGVDILHVRREVRQGFKAGALAWGLTLSDAEFVAIFDADFTPLPDFLRRGLIERNAFADPDVAFVQGRWTFRNDLQNLLTRAQSILIDRHFAIQKPYQSSNGRTLTFNGSAGIWRRSAIDAAGGWTADTLCEDLDLSYRCALAGYRGAYDLTLTCPSEIPATILAFKLQQRRWAKGTMQCLRKLTGRVIRSERIGHKGEDVYAMAGYAVHPIMLLYSLLWPWVVLCQLPEESLLPSQVVMTVANVTVITGFLLAAFASGRSPGVSVAKDLGFALILGMGLMVNTTMAIVAGWLERGSVFERTPKQGGGTEKSDTQLTKPPLPLHWTIWPEMLFLAYMLWLTVLLVDAGRGGHALSCLLFVASMSFMVVAQLFERFGYLVPATMDRTVTYFRQVLFGSNY